MHHVPAGGRFSVIYRKRESERFDFPKTIDYSVEQQAAGEGLIGISINISQKGLCMYTFAPHSEGQQVVIKSPLPVEHRVATVRWIQKEDEGLFRIGLGFNVEPSEGFRKKTNA